VEATRCSSIYTLDAVGNHTQRVDRLGTHVYNYDKLYRITKADYPGTDVTDHTYDAVGNRKTMVTGAGTTQYAYDAADRLTSGTPPRETKRRSHHARCPCLLTIRIPDDGSPTH
jgi:YD repeat-containing protein